MSDPVSTPVLLRKAFWLLLVLTIFSCSNRDDSLKPKLSTINESVYASVTIVPRNSYLPYASRSGVVQQVRVEEGDTVQPGQVLFTVAAPGADNRLIDARLSLEQAREDFRGENNLLENTRAELEVRKKQLALDSLNLTRLQRLWEQKIGSKIELDRAEVQYDASRKAYEVLRQQYRQQVQELETRYRKAQNMVESEREVLADYTVRARMRGKVYTVFKEAGELISPQEPFAEIGSPDAFKIKMDIDEVDITRIQKGDRAAITLDAYPDQAFEAHITKIFPKKDLNTQTFLVEGEFRGEAPQLYFGMSGEANILIATREKALTIPTEYLLPGDKVLTADGEQAVEIGLRNLEFVEVVSGIDTSTKLLKPNP